MIVYLAGPMTGIPYYNFPAFEEAAAELRERGIEVISPAEMDLEDGLVPDPNGEDSQPRRYAYYLARDIRVIAERDVEAVVVLQGWEKSGGAKTEVAFIRALKRPVLRYPDLVEIIEMPAVLTEVQSYADRSA